MAQLDICRNKGNSNTYPYLMVLQSDLMETDTLIVAPLMAAGAFNKALQVYPEIVVEGEAWLIVIPHMAAVSKAVIGDRITTGEHLRKPVLSAIDRLFTGF